jgi:hypothetical protein
MATKITLDNTVKSNLDIVFDLLGGVGVESFLVGFDGGGDDGQVEGVAEIKPSRKKVVEAAQNLLGDPVEGARVSDGERWSPSGVEKLWKSDPTMAQMIDSVCYEALEKVCSGWEINEGSYGVFLFDVKKRTVSLDFNERVIESNLTQYEM